MNTQAIFLRRLRLAVKESTAEVIDRAKQAHSYKNHTGMLEREGLADRYENQKLTGIVSISPRVGYAGYVHEGFPAHTIKPRFRKALRWAANGEFHFAGRVHHPGFKGDPFLYNAFDASQKEIGRIFDRQVELACQEVENDFAR